MSRASPAFVLSEIFLSWWCSIPSQIRNPTSDPSYSSPSGQCKAAPVTQIGGEQLSKRYRGRIWVCVCVCVLVKRSGGGLLWDKRKKKDKGQNDKGREERWGAWSGFRQDNGSPSDIWALSARKGRLWICWERFRGGICFICQRMQQI